MYNFSADSSKTNIQIFDFSSQRHPIDDSTDAIYLSYTKLSSGLTMAVSVAGFYGALPRSCIGGGRDSFSFL